MLPALKQRLLAFAKAKVKPVDCPKCGERFTPFADREIVEWNDFVGTEPCPHCGHGYSFQPSQDAELMPLGPLPHPEGSRIEKRPVTEGQVLYYVPATGRGGFLLFFAVLWNGFIAVFLALMAGARFSGEGTGNPSSLMPFVFMIPFVAAGVGMAYAGLRAKYAIHLLFLGPEFIRLQRQLFGRRKTYDLSTAEIDRAEQKEFYQQNYQPVYGIEIGAGKRRIRFGSALTDDEKKWLCAEIREFLRHMGNPSFSAISPKLPTDSTRTNLASQTPLGDIAPILPESTRIVREAPSADEVIYHIPPSRSRWGTFLPVGLFFIAIAGFGLIQESRKLLRDLPSSSELPVFFNAFPIIINSIGVAVCSGLCLAGLGLLYAAIRHRFLRHDLILNREEVRLNSFLQGCSGRAIPLQQVKSVDLFELFKTNGKPVFAIRVSGERQSFQFGFRLTNEEKSWLAADMRRFLRNKGVLGD